MRAERLLQLFPRAWRGRYGDEFLAVVGDEPLSLRQAIDIVACAIDARFSADVRRAARAAQPVQGENVMSTRLKACCASSQTLSMREALIGAGVIIGASLALMAIGMLFERAGSEDAGEAILSLAFPASLLLSMPFTYLKGKSWQVQLLLVALPMAILALIGLIAQRF